MDIDFKLRGSNNLTFAFYSASARDFAIAIKAFLLASEIDSQYLINLLYFLYKVICCLVGEIVRVRD